MTTAVFLGRFQPLHKGHLSVLRGAARKYDRLTIIIGSPTTQKTRTAHNPLTTIERRALFREVLKEFPIPVRIITQRDIGNNEMWRREMLKKIPVSATVISGNSLVLRVLGSQRRVEKARMLAGVHGTRIRAMMRRGDGRWRRLVPRFSLPLLARFNMEAKLRAQAHS